MTLIRDTEKFKEFAAHWRVSYGKRLSKQDAFDLLVVSANLIGLMAAEIEYLQKKAGLK